MSVAARHTVEDTGRIGTTVGHVARRILFGDSADVSIDAELPHVTEIDQAHVLMLLRRGLLEEAPAARLLNAIGHIAGEGYRTLRGRPAPRGIYLSYEQELIERVGLECGGMLQLGRSRNDLNATVLRLRLRQPWRRLVRESLRLQAVLIRRAERFASTVMPAYTHGQPALPISYGHYLAGVACALSRDTLALFQAAGTLDALPLGAGAVGGTSWPIEPDYTAGLLGFSGVVSNSVDAVASRDGVLRLLGAAAILGVTLSRVATDHLAWLGQELGLLALPDRLVGSSSMMPQKRNPYLLEHVQGKSAAAAAALSHAIVACHAKPFSNAIAVGTEAMVPVLGALGATTDAVTLLRLVVAGVEPNPDAMRRRAQEGHTAATELANEMVRYSGLSFRAAHHEVGRCARTAAEDSQSLETAVRAWNAERRVPVPTDALDVEWVVRRSEHGGGPGPCSLARTIAALRADWRVQAERLQQVRQRWAAARAALGREVERRSLTVERGVAASSGAWVVPARRRPNARARLVCFPYAGGGASMFVRWAAQLGEDIDICAVQLPGRETRLAEPPGSSLRDLSARAFEAIEAWLDVPWAVFGHSMGALLGFELALLAERVGKPPRCLVVSGARAPHLSREAAALSHLSDTDFRAEIAQLGGTEPSVLEHEELSSLVLPTLRADFAAIEAYRAPGEARLRCPVAAVAWTADDSASRAHVAEWSRWSTGPTTLHHLTGGHFAIQHAPAALLQLVREALGVRSVERHSGTTNTEVESRG